MTLYLPFLQSGLHKLIHEQKFTYPLGTAYPQLSYLLHPGRTLPIQSLRNYPHLCRGDLCPRICASLTHVSSIQIYVNPNQDNLS